MTVNNYSSMNNDPVSSQTFHSNVFVHLLSDLKGEKKQRIELESHNSTINHFTVVCLVTWPLNGSKAGGDLVFDRDLTVFVV